MSPVELKEFRKPLPPRISRLGWTLTAISILLIIAAFITDQTRSSFNALIFFMFLTSIGIGSLFLVALEYVVGAVWSTPVRRISEFLSSLIIFLPVIAVLLLLNVHELFHWTHSEAVQQDTTLQLKSPYLNMNFFIIRVVFVYAIWLIFYWVISRNSVKQDLNGDQLLTKKNIKFSAAFMPIFAITLTIAAVDWIMSLEPHWYSTIYGVYYFSGTVLAALASATIIIVLLKENGYLHQGLVRDHYYSLGALLFAFTNFWAYIAFSQYLLIWYANIPEETVWILQRWQGSWKYVSIGLIIIHFVIPYFALLSQPAKMNPKRLLIISVWILFAHLYDLYWLIMPTYSRTNAVFSWYELVFPLAAVGLIILLIVYKTKRNNLIPIGDPKLKRGLEFRL